MFELCCHTGASTTVLSSSTVAWTCLKLLDDCFVTFVNSSPAIGFRTAKQTILAELFQRCLPSESSYPPTVELVTAGLLLNTKRFFRRYRNRPAIAATSTTTPATTPAMMGVTFAVDGRVFGGRMGVRPLPLMLPTDTVCNTSSGKVSSNHGTTSQRWTTLPQPSQPPPLQTRRCWSTTES
jgi:hypothetical protein